MRARVDLALGCEKVHEMATMCLCFFDDVHSGVVIAQVPQIHVAIE